MGYCMSMTESKFNVKKENIGYALDAVKSLAKENNHLSWVDSQTVIEADTFEEAMEEFRYDVIVDENGNANYICFIGEKLGDDEDLFSVIAPFVESGSYIEMCGEEGEFWKWRFKDGKFSTVYAEKVYPDE